MSEKLCALRKIGGGNGNIIELGNSTTQNLNVSGMLSNYTSLTADDFLIVVNSVTWTANNITKTFSPLINKSYNSSTGLLSFSVNGGAINNATIYYIKL